MKAIRRIVTGHNAEGRSCIVEDGAPPVTRTVASRPGFQTTNVWTTTAIPEPVDAPDRVAEHTTLHPPASGTVIRVIDFPPEPKDAGELAAFYAPALGEENPFPDMHKVDADRSRHPRMHTTDTVDYAIILEGEIYAVMDVDETLMKAGDILVQRGTNHAWSNRSDANCRICFVLIDGTR
ncbi:MAG: cupin domain-containing protein [Alphaproteobacteria bacterium]